MSALTGTRTLLRTTAEQDRFAVAPWVALISALSASSVLVYAWVFPDEASRLELATTVGANPAMAIIFGPARDLATADGFNAWRAQNLGTFFAGLMAVLVVVRNSRANEDSGQAELLASAPIGRAARLATAVALAWAASLALGVVSALLTVALGGSVVDSLTLSATFTASGLMFGGVGAVAAQVASDARSASTMAVTALGVAFLVRGYVDSSTAPDRLIWLSPLGWLQEVRPGAGNDWTPLLAALALAVTTVATAFAVQARRDFGQGLLATAPGPARGGAAATLGGSALVLHRGALAAWLPGLAVVGAVWGTLATSIGDLFAENPAIGRLIAAGGASRASLELQFVQTIVTLLGILAALLGVQVVMRLRTEELGHRVEPLLATATTRARLLGVHALVAFGGSALGLVAGGSVMAAVAAAGSDVPAGDVVGQALLTVPATWVLVALALAAVGARPGVRLVGWAGIVLSFAITILGPVFRLDDWVLAISPFWHVPDVVDVEAAGLAGLLAVAVGLVLVAFGGFRRRDVG